MPTCLEQILQAPFVPTVYPLPAEILAAYADVLYEEGFPALEVLARPLDTALEAMKKINQLPQRKRILWGLGTMTTRTAAQQAVELQPDFLVSPAFSHKILEVCVKADIPYIPAVLTFQDVQDVLDAFEEYGIPVKILKLCPIQELSTEYVRLLGGCFPGITFCPTGGINRENFVEWLRAPYVAAPMESHFVPRELLINGDFEAVRVRLREIRALAAEARSLQQEGLSELRMYKGAEERRRRKDVNPFDE